MSLVSDALRKAQVETAQRDRVQHRFYLAHGGGPAKASSVVTRGPVMLAAVLGGCVTAGAALLYFGRTAIPTVAPAERAAGIVPRAIVTSSAGEISARPPVNAAASVVPVAAAAPRRQDRPPRPERKVKAASAAAAPAREEAPPRARSSRDSFVNGETYASPVQGPMGTELALSGISSARGKAVAIINGTLVRPGGVVGPFVIEEVEPRRVRVRYVDVHFWLTY